MISDGIIGQRVKTPTLNVTFELAIPDLRVKLKEPLAKRPEVLRRKRSHLFFDLFNPRHDMNLPYRSSRAEALGLPMPNLCRPLRGSPLASWITKTWIANG